MTDITTTLKTIVANSAAPKPDSAPKADYQNLAFHPLAEMFPLIGDAELRELAEDIRCNGLIEFITLCEGKILDGRNRYRALKSIGLPVPDNKFRVLPEGADPRAFVVSENIQRRHLSADQKRDLLEKLIKADPTKSNRQIAATAKVSHHTVGEVRNELETTGQVAQLETTTGKDGKSRRTKGGKGKGKGGTKAEPEKITYAKVVDAKTATNAYSVLEEHLLDALQDVNDMSSFAHADDYARRTIEKLEEKLGQLEPEDEEAEAA